MENRANSPEGIRFLRTRTLAGTVVAAVAVLGILVGCAAPPSAHLVNPTPSGAVHIFTNIKGSGTRTTGPFTGSGTISISFDCIGTGKVWVTVSPHLEKFGPVCTAPDEAAGNSNIVTEEFTDGTSTTFSVTVTAAKNTYWIISGSASKK